MKTKEKGQKEKQERSEGFSQCKIRLNSCIASLVSLRFALGSLLDLAHASLGLYRVHFCVSTTK